MKQKFKWAEEKIKNYLPIDWQSQTNIFQVKFRNLIKTEYHDEHDIYRPFETFLKKACALDKVAKKPSKPTEFCRNKKPKGFASQEIPDFSIGNDGAFHIEIKNREDLDKTSGRRSPHQQALDYLEASPSPSVVILFNLEVVRFYLKFDQYRVLISEDYNVEAGNAAEAILISILHSESPLFAGRQAQCLRPFLASNDSRRLTSAVAVELVDLYVSLLTTSKRSATEANRAIVCRLSFIFLSESWGLVPKGVTLKILSEKGISNDGLKAIFTAFNNGSKSHEIPKFNGRLFKSSLIQYQTKSLRSIAASIKRISELVEASNAEIDDELPGSILETLMGIEHSSEKAKKADLIGDAQKRITNRMEGGVFYTGKIVSELAAAELIKFGTPTKNHNIMDFCAGSGSLLLPLVRKMATQINLGEKKSDYYESISSVIVSNLYAVDCDPTACELLRLNLAVDTAKFGVPLVDSSESIEKRDALTLNGSLQESMDLLISNPPYLGWEKIQQEDCDLNGDKLKKRSEWFAESSRPDLWYFFFEKALSLLKPNGIVAFVVTDTWIATERGKCIRSLFKKDLSLLKIVHTGYPLFPGSTSCPSIIIAKKVKPKKDNIVVVDSYWSDSGKPETVNAIKKGKPLKNWKLSQKELSKWLGDLIPFGNELEVRASRIKSEKAVSLKQTALVILDPRLQGKVAVNKIVSRRESGSVPVMAGRGFGEKMGYVKKSLLPENWTYVGKPALLIHQKGRLIETEVVKSCPAIWKTVTVITSEGGLASVSDLEILDDYLQSDEFKKWYLMRYSTTWTQGGYQFMKNCVENFLCPKELRASLLMKEKKAAS